MYFATGWQTRNSNQVEMTVAKCTIVNCDYERGMYTYMCEPIVKSMQNPKRIACCTLFLEHLKLANPALKSNWLSVSLLASKVMECTIELHLQIFKVPELHWSWWHW